MANGFTKDGYHLYRSEGSLFDPKKPQPSGTVPLYSWWNGERRDNFATTDPRWSMDPSAVAWNGDHVRNGRQQDGYGLYRLEGYVFDPRRAQPSGTVPLYSWWNGERRDNFTTTDPRWSMDPTAIEWNGDHIRNGRQQDGYVIYRLEGYVFV